MADATSIEQFIASPNSYTRIIISSKNIDAAAVSRLANALRGNNTVITLDLYNNQIGDAGAASLGQGLAGNSTLTKLNLARNQIGDAGAASLAASLKGNSTLSHLYLNDNQIESEGIEQIDGLTTRNQEIFYTVKTALESIASSDESDGSEHNIHAFDLKYYQSVNSVIFMFDDQQHNKINNYIHNNFFHLTALCKTNLPIIEANVDDIVLPQFVWADICSYLKLSDVNLDSSVPVDEGTELSENDEEKDYCDQLDLDHINTDNQSHAVELLADNYDSV